MKINKSKFVVGALLTLTSVSVAGSVVGTAAWYTYNTKASVTYSGIASGNSENLQIKLASESTEKYRADIEKSELTAESTNAGYAGANLAPVSLNAAQASDKNIAGTFVCSPSYLEPNVDKAAKDANGKYMYFKASFDLRVEDPVNEGEYLAKNVYISYLKCTAKTVGEETEPKDITSGVRMHFNSGTAYNYLVAPGKTTSGTTAIGGTADFNNDGKTDQGYLQADGSYSPFKGTSESDSKVDVKYGVYTDAAKATPAVESYLGTNDVVTKFKDGKVDGAAKSLITKTNTDGSAARVNLTIWLEGWDPAVIDANAGAEFDLDVLFQVENL